MAKGMKTHHRKLETNRLFERAHSLQINSGDNKKKYNNELQTIKN